jgi:hypothetical protein
VAATVNAGLLFLLALRRLPALAGDGLGRSFALHAAASLGMGAAVVGWCAVSRNVWGLNEAWWIVGSGVVVGAIVYVAAALAMGSAEIVGIKNLVAGRLAAMRVR